MPSNTPGRRKGSQASQRQKSEIRNPRPEGSWESRRVQANRANAIIAVAAAAARKNEFHRALWPAANAPGNSVQVRLTETNWNTGSPTEIRQSRMVQKPQNQNHPGPSCWRKSLAETAP